ncbi:MAG: hypothetical protein NZM37_13190 [Sandaracinaceae bacterium]|nr:hypothetical protein [Sandaracinaceae bacterium]MDW8246937.1 hypothetical protein [Sandaracinaceae bacterium]
MKSTSRTSRASPSGTAAAMKSLAQRHAASLRPSLSIDEISQEARRIVMENDATALAALIDGLTAERGVAERSKHIDEILAVKPDMFVAFIDRFVQLILSPHKKAAQSAASVLPVMAKLAPARVAKHLSVLIEGFDQATEGGRDGLVSTFAALCTASVAYQKRLEPVLEKALEVAEPKSLRRWAEVILPALKGEPHARARAVVEGRLPRIPRSLALPIATFLGVKLRPGSQTG